jgi:hypothetical protein
MTEAADRWFWVWDLYFSVVYLAVVVMLLVMSSAPAADRFGSVAALTAVIPWYALLGRSLILAEDFGWRIYVFVLGVLACLATSVFLTPLSSYALFGAVPMIFMSLRLMSAIFLALIPMGVIGTAFSVLIGIWIERVITQSTERRGLIEKLEATRAEVSRL